MMKILMRIWGMFPLWVHTLAVRMLRPRFVVGVAALVFDEQGRVLLFKHTYRKFPWGLPGGALEYGEQPEEAIIREFHEETGMSIEVKRLLLGHSSPYFHHVGLVYLSRVVGGEFRESYEISEIGYFEIDNLPQMLFDEKELIRSVHKDLFKHELA
ncbi:MAG: NUDIX domain-containing protein [Anaerolineales bacterium]|nr:NUDIX domain-containing protein [Anaerolineales bacterium]